MCIRDRSTRKLFFVEVSRSTKLASHLINWFNIEDIRRELEKYNKKRSKIEDVTLLMSKFDLSELRFAVVASLATLGLDITVLPPQKSNIIEVFSQIIFDEMSIMVDFKKAANRYV